MGVAGLESRRKGTTVGSGTENENWRLRMITVYYIHGWNVIGKLITLNN